MTIINPQDLAQAAEPTAPVVTTPQDLAQSSTTAPAEPTQPAEPAQPVQAAPAPPQPAFWSAQDAQKANGMQPTFESKIQQLVAMSKGRVWINSGFRSDALQAKLYAQAKIDHPQDPGMWVAPPGQSNHNRGLAADLGGDIGYAHQIAAQLGLTFPMSWEPWHIEPAGLRTGGASAQAYTTPPPGQVNPTQDPTSTPQENLAHLSNTMTGADFSSSAPTTDTTVGNRFANPTGSLEAATTGGIQGSGTAATAGNFAGVPSISGADTRTGNVSSPGSFGGGTVNTSVGNVTPQAASPNQQAYINEVMPFAQAESKRTGIPAEVMVVQSGVETGWGTSGWWTNNRNPAGIGVTGQAGAGNSYPDLASAFRDYADKLMGNGEAGQEQFAADVKAGAPVDKLLADLEQAPWAAGHYGGNGLGQTYSALQQGGAFRPPAPATPAPQSAPSNERRNRAF